MPVSSIPYPANLVVDYPDRRLNRPTSVFRLLTIIPVLLILGLLVGAPTLPVPFVNISDRAPRFFSILDRLSVGSKTLDATDQRRVSPMPSDKTQEIQPKQSMLAEERQQFWTDLAINLAKILGILAALTTVRFIRGPAGLIVLPTVLMILFKRKYPRWWFDWSLAVTKFGARVLIYAMLLRDEYPSTSEDQAVHIDVPYPDVPKDLSRWLPLVKWLLLIPHYIALLFLFMASLVCTVIAWFSILSTGHYPRRLRTVSRRMRHLA